MDCHAEGPIPVTSGPVSITSPVLITSARLLGGAAVVILSVAGCTSVTGGDPTVNAVDAPVYRTSVSLSSSQSVASASARESERQASMTIQAVHATCETLSTTSADAIDAVVTKAVLQNGRALKGFGHTNFCASKVVAQVRARRHGAS